MYSPIRSSSGEPKALNVLTLFFRSVKRQKRQYILNNPFDRLPRHCSSWNYIPSHPQANKWSNDLYLERRCSVLSWLVARVDMRSIRFVRRVFLLCPETHGQGWTGIKGQYKQKLILQLLNLIPRFEFEIRIVWSLICNVLHPIPARPWKTKN